MTWAGTGPSGTFWTLNIGGGLGRVDWEFPGGDVDGPIDALIVVGLQGQSISTAVPIIGDVLTFNGSEWLPVASGSPAGSGVGPHALLSTVHTDTIPASPTNGDIIIASGASASWIRFPAGTPGQFLGIDSGNLLDWYKPSATPPTIVSSGSIINLTSNDDKIIVKTGIPTNINLPGIPTFGQQIIIKDGLGSANSNLISILPPSGITIDGQSLLVMGQNYQAFTLLWNGTEWNII